MDGALLESLALSPRERRAAVLGLIRGAQRRLALTVFRCNDYAVLDEIGAALDRGVRVDVLVNRRPRGWKREPDGLPGVLTRMGARVHGYPRPDRSYHAKFLVADDGPGLVGSLNLTRGCFERTVDFALVTHDPMVVYGLWQLFDLDCRGAAFDATPGASRLVVAPEQARQRLTGLVAEARSSVRILDHKLRDPAVLALLHARRADGLEVDVLGKRDVLPYRAHGRMMLVDGQTAVIGSAALSPRSLDTRRELGILVRDPELVQRLGAFLRWASNGGGDDAAWRAPGEPSCTPASSQPS